MRIKSNGYIPRFQFAYDSDEFTKRVNTKYYIQSVIYKMYKNDKFNFF
jgi:hypothetical protein